MTHFMIYMVPSRWKEIFGKLLKFKRSKHIFAMRICNTYSAHFQSIDSALRMAGMIS